MDTPKLTRVDDLKLPMAVLGMSELGQSEDWLIAACMDGVYRVQLGEGSFERIDTHGSYVSSAVLRQHVAVTAGYDGMLHWFDLQRGERVRQTKLHDFWSWDMALSPDQSMVASVTGQYLAGGYKYEPQPEREPSVKIVAADTGQILHQLPHVPSVQAVAFSPDSRHVAAGNLMGEVRVWNTQTGGQVAGWTTPDFTSWGIIKSHCYLGGIFALEFSPDGEFLFLAGMGPMKDPMAGNGRHLWQKWAWKNDPPNKADETHQGESGEGLMEALAFSPDGRQFAMGGRLRGGQWNVALFDAQSGKKQASLKTGYRVTGIRYTAAGDRLVLVGTQGQPRKKKDGQFPPFGRIETYSLG